MAFVSRSCPSTGVHDLSQKPRQWRQPVIPTLTWRALTADDAAALARVLAAVEAVDSTGEHSSEQDFRDELEDHAVDLGTDTLAALDPDGELIAFARVQGPAELGDLNRVYGDGAVLPAARGHVAGRSQRVRRSPTLTIRQIQVRVLAGPSDPIRTRVECRPCPWFISTCPATC
jgi:hypothetical protein